jgi:hypothetical protein
MRKRAADWRSDTVHPDEPIFRQALARILAAAPDDRGERRRREAGEGISKEESHPGVFERWRWCSPNWAISTSRSTGGAGDVDGARGRPDVAQKWRQSGPLCSAPNRVPWRNDDPDHSPATGGANVRPGAGSVSWMGSDRLEKK